MLRSIGSRMALLALAAGVMWGCDGERATQPQPLGKAAADGSAVVVVTVQQDGAPVSGVVVELSRSIAGVAASYEWSGTTDKNGQARIEVTSSGYYQARVVQDGHEVGYQSSIPLNVGTEFALNLTIAALVPSADPRDVTRAYVEAGIARYEREGLEAMLAYYNNWQSVEGERSMMILQAGDQTVLASVLYPGMIGTNTFSSPNTPLGSLMAQATAEGYWFENFSLNPATQQPEPSLFLAILHDNLIFVSVHSLAREDVAAVTQDYVQRAIAMYERDGLEATIAYYDSRASVNGQFYLFLIDENDLYLVHPIFPHLKGTDIKEVVGSDGQELGEEIAEATEEGHWVDYLWPNPETGLEEPKSAWVIRRDGLIFASGYYTSDPDAEPPAWKDADPREYTVTYVEQAIARYERDGLDAMKNYYNSVASFEGQFYMFIMDANDLYIVHPLLPHLIGTDIKDVVGSDGYELGKEIAEATEEGHWVDYLWPHPFTLQDAPKVAYAVRHDGLIFVSGYYPLENPRAKTQAYVAAAIEYYKENGLEATRAYYNSPESFDGQWFLVMIDENQKYLVFGLNPALVGRTTERTTTEEGQWSISTSIDNPITPEEDIFHRWSILYDGLIFWSGYFTSE